MYLYQTHTYLHRAGLIVRETNKITEEYCRRDV